MSPQNLLELAKPIRLLMCDVDGVLTDGHIYYSHPTSEQFAFHVHDGVGLMLLKHAGIEVAIITTSQSPVIQPRMNFLGIDELHQGIRKKITTFEHLLDKYNLKPEMTAYIGDDIPDLPVIKQVGLGVAVANAHHHVRDAAHWITQNPGGHGAVRELCDLILTAQNKMDSAIELLTQA